MRESDKEMRRRLPNKSNFYDGHVILGMMVMILGGYDGHFKTQWISF